MLKITICSIGQKMPKWVDEATKDLGKRLIQKIQVDWVELPLIKRTNPQQLNQIFEREYHTFLEHIPPRAYLIALDAQGKLFNSEQLASRMDDLQNLHSHLCIIIGGPEGLHPKLLKKAQEKWSLSPLTFPHPLVRIILMESLYRSWCIMNNHPYHK
jgi:23S rRNA (pseudouridine1915-N3)-methyltransferase